MLTLLIGLVAAFGSPTATGSPGGSTSGIDGQPYTLAYKQSVEQDKPLMVVVGAGYCPACDVLKKTTLASMQRSGELEQVAVAVVDKDAEPELAKTLMKDEPMIPQIIVFTKTNEGGWARRQLTGYQPIQPVRSLLRRISGMRQG